VQVVSGESSYSERRLIENEQIMEALNRRLQEHVARIRSEGDADQSDLVSCFCECSDLSCRGRILISPERYEEIHRDPSLFIVLAGHEEETIESVVDTWMDHLIVRKRLLA
jgi:hypothetical protein